MIKPFLGNGHGNCIDLETREVYWITGIKKTRSNRHQFGRGIINIDKDAVDEYESITGIKVIENRNFKIVTVTQTNIQRFEKLLNEKI